MVWRTIWNQIRVNCKLQFIVSNITFFNDILKFWKYIFYSFLYVRYIRDVSEHGSTQHHFSLLSETFNSVSFSLSLFSHPLSYTLSDVYGFQTLYKDVPRWDLLPRTVIPRSHHSNNSNNIGIWTRISWSKCKRCGHSAIYPYTNLRIPFNTCMYI